MDEGPFTPRAIVTPIQPWDWPQDKVQIPAGHGMMPDVELQNQFMVRQEGFVYSTVFEAVTFGSVAQSITIPTDPDGDFWCDSIMLVHFDSAGVVVNTGLKMQIEDVRTARQLFMPHGRTSMFTKPVGRSLSGQLMQPYPFTRNGGIKIILENDVYSDDPIDVHLSFIGWKEYQYASR